MKKIITLFILFLTLPTMAQWVQQNSGTNELLNDVYCITEDIVVVVGNNGTILKTIDGGANWIAKYSNNNYDLIKVQFPTATVGYAIGGNPSTGLGILLKSINGGETWSTIILQDLTIIKDISCVNENVFYLTGSDSNNYKLLKTSMQIELGYQKLATVAGPPSPLKPNEPLPAKVVIIPVGSIL